jgi:hypothetical protein
LIRRHADEIGDDVLVVARHASGYRPSGSTARSTCGGIGQARPCAERWQAARWKALAAIPSFRAP